MKTLSVSEGSSELQQILLSGMVTEGESRYHALPTALRGRSVEFRLVPESSLERPSALKVWFTAMRPISLTATLTPCVGTVLLGLALGWTITPWIAILALAGALCLQMSVNLLNDVEDYLRMIDMPGSLGGAGVIQKGWISARQAKSASYLLLGVGALFGVPAFLRDPVTLLWIGLVAVIGTFGYSGKPFGLKYRALGDLAVFVMCGPGLTAGMSIAAFGSSSPLVIGLGFYFGLAACGILHVNNFQDIELDRSRGATTLAAVAGAKGSKVLLVAFYAGAYAAWAWAWSRSGLHWAALVGALVSVPLVLKLLSKTLGAKDMNAPGLELVRIEAAQLHLAMGVALCLGLGAALALR